MPTYFESITVLRPLSETFRLFSDFQRFPAFMPWVQEVRRTGERSLYWRAEIGDQLEQGQVALLELRPDARIAWGNISEAGGGGSVSFEMLDEHTTRVDFHFEYQPRGIVESVGAVFGVVNERIRHALERFKQLAEAGGQEEQDGPLDEERQRMADAGSWPPQYPKGEFIVGRRLGDPKPFTRLPPGEKGSSTQRN